MKTKLIYGVLIIMILFALAGCGNKNEGTLVTVVGKFGGYYDNEYGHRVQLKYVFLVEET
jgi:hypothetical protein